MPERGSTKTAAILPRPDETMQIVRTIGIHTRWNNKGDADAARRRLALAKAVAAIEECRDGLQQHERHALARLVLSGERS